MQEARGIIFIVTTIPCSSSASSSPNHHRHHYHHHHHHHYDHRHHLQLQAVAFVMKGNGGKHSNDTKLKFYALFKQV
jgi:hypothetical protein